MDATSVMTFEQREAILDRLFGWWSGHDSLVTRMARTVASEIIENRIKPGSDLNSVELAARFSSSRTPAREALMILEREGLVTIPPRRRPRVATFEVERVNEIYVLRAELNAIAARRVASLSDPDVSSLEKAVAMMRAAAAEGDTTSFFWANVAFHEHETEIGGNLTLKKTIDSLGVQVLRLRHITLSLPGRMASSLASHELLLDCYARGDTVLAGALAYSIVDRARIALEESRVLTTPSSLMSESPSTSEWGIIPEEETSIAKV